MRSSESRDEERISLLPKKQLNCNISIEKSIKAEYEEFKRAKKQVDEAKVQGIPKLHQPSSSPSVSPSSMHRKIRNVGIVATALPQSTGGIYCIDGNNNNNNNRKVVESSSGSLSTSSSQIEMSAIRSLYTYQNSYNINDSSYSNSSRSREDYSDNSLKEEEQEQEDISREFDKEESGGGFGEIFFGSDAAPKIEMQGVDADNFNLLLKHYHQSKNKWESKSTYNMFKAVLVGSIILCGVILFAFYEVIFFSNSSSQLPIMGSVVDGNLFDFKPLPRFKLVPDATTTSHEKDSYFVVDELDDSIVFIKGRYSKDIHSAGWNYLSISSTFGNNVNSPISSSSSSSGISLDSEASYNYFVSMKAAGYLEGITTCTEIKYWYSNFYSGLFDGGDAKKAEYDYIVSNHKWMVDNANKYYKTSKYWFTVRGLLYQLDGLVEGAKLGCPSPLKKASSSSSPSSSDASVKEDNILSGIEKYGFHLHHFLLMNANGDLYQIADKYNQKNSTKRKDDDAEGNQEWDDVYMTPSDILLGNIDPMVLRKKHRDHCSAIIKVLDGNSDIVFGHNTWDDYQCAYPRIFKHYSLPFVKLSSHKTDDIDSVKEIFDEVSENLNQRVEVEEGKVGGGGGVDASKSSNLFISVSNSYFSSSPGLLSSVDDFFIVRGAGNLAVTETTIDVSNDDLYKFIYPETMLSWMRARIANHLSVDGSTWARWFAHKSSGTYVNQWMALDLNKFKSGSPPENGFLTVLEEIPGKVHFADKTDTLRSTSYWASYNNPYFSDIQILSGNAALCEENANLCHDTDPRALIFKARHELVKDISSLKSLMGYNDIHDVNAHNDSCNAISCRMDLEPAHKYQYPFGAIDAKISSVQSVMSSSVPTIHARLGPTHDTVAPFCWHKFDYIRNVRGLPLVHDGHPDCFDYHWTIFPPI